MGWSWRRRRAVDVVADAAEESERYEEGRAPADAVRIGWDFDEFADGSWCARRVLWQKLPHRVDGVSRRELCDRIFDFEESQLAAGYGPDGLVIQE